MSARGRDGGAGRGHEGTRHASGAHAAHHGAAPSQRQLRVAEEVRHLLSGVFARGEFRDPDLADAQLTVTEVRASPDLKHATVFVSRLGRTDVDALLPALKRASVFLRGQVAQGLRLKFAPDLHFQPDHALDQAMRIDALLHSPQVRRDLAAHGDAASGSGDAPASGEDEE